MSRRTRWYGLLVGLAALLVAFAPPPKDSAPAGGTRTVRVEASQFSYSPSVIPVKRGDRITIELVSKDVVHGLYVDGYGVSVEADPGQTRTLSFVADRAGSFRIRCNVTCGAMHPFMIGKLNVGDNLGFLRAAGLTFVGVAGLMLLARPAAGEASQA